jgi:hypothetical protein
MALILLCHMKRVSASFVPDARRMPQASDIINLTNDGHFTLFPFMLIVVFSIGNHTDNK